MNKVQNKGRSSEKTRALKGIKASKFGHNRIELGTFLNFTVFRYRKMPRVRYDVTKPLGLLGQYGGGLDDAYFRGYRFQRGTAHLQRGRGVLGVIGKVGKYVFPWLKKTIAPLAKEALKALGEEGLEAGQKALAGMAKGQAPKEAIVTEGTQALKNLTRRAGHRMVQAGSGRKGVKRKKPTISALHVLGRSVLESKAKKRRRADTGGLY